MFIVDSSDLDPVEDIGLFTFLVMAVTHETVPDFKGAFVNTLR
jgi:hypothetical protein